jgi:hypothetical protein
MRARSTMLVAGFALVVMCAAAPAAGASTISGRVAGTLPKPRKGLNTVRAVRAKDLVIVRVAKVRSHRYRLKVPAGRYFLFAATRRFRGKKGIDRPVGKVMRLRAGKTKKVRVSLKKRRKRAHAAAQAGLVTVKHPAVWIKHFAVSGPPDARVLGKGVADMLITDVIPVIQRACGGVIVEREKFNYLVGEILQSQGPAGDPSTRLSMDKIIAHNREVTGRVTVGDTTTTLTATVTNIVTGGTRSVTRSAPNDRFFDLVPSIVEELARLICGEKPPSRYTGPASGSLSAVSGSSSQTLTWNGTVSLKFTGDVVGEIPGDPPGEYAMYTPESGSFHVILDGVDGDCTYHGTTDVTIVPNPDELSRVQQGVDRPAYVVGAHFPADTPHLQYTITGPPHCGGGSSSIYPLAGRVFLGRTDGATQQASSTTLAGSATWVIGPDTLKWSWSLAPQA